jgi:lysophospholipase L1-like esterase
VVFVGSSSIRLWPDITTDFPGVNVIQRGFGGAELAQVVYRAPKIVTPYRPRLIVLYAGDNDLAAGATPQEVFDRYKSFVQLVRGSLPETRIAFVSIKPSGARAELIAKTRTANSLIKDYASKHPHLSYVDVFTPMLDASGHPRTELFDVDHLHLNAKGYELWRDMLAPIVQGTAQ